MRVVVPGDGQDGPRHRLCASGCGFGVGGVGDSICVFGRGQFGGSACEREEYVEGPHLSPRSDGGVHGGAASGGPGEDRPRERSVSDDGTGRRGVVSRGLADGGLWAEGTGTAAVEGGGAAELLRL